MQTQGYIADCTESVWFAPVGSNPGPMRHMLSTGIVLYPSMSWAANEHTELTHTFTLEHRINTVETSIRTEPLVI